MRTIWYLCDGERPECKKKTCYKNGGECRHTRDIKHALNFSRSEHGDYESYRENEKKGW